MAGDFIKNGEALKLKILVVGSGIMGNGIAQIFAKNNHKVFINDLNDDILRKARESVKTQLAIMKRNGFLDEAGETTALDNIIFCADLPECAKDIDIAFEAIPEKQELKEALFQKLEKYCPEKTVIATNTSGIAINILAKAVNRRDKLVGTHFFNPADLVPLVEVIPNQATSGQTVETVMSALRAAGKKPVKIAKDLPGFIGNRLQHALAREAMSLVQKGVATPEDIDEVVKSSLALRMVFIGPLEQRDLNGLDTHLSIASYLYKDLEDSHAPLQILEDKVASGKWGIKSGEGFYDWSGKPAAEVTARHGQELIDIIKFLRKRG
jgi:3-hydroxybutyryl-CoA dehydrogenase